MLFDKWTRMYLYFRSPLGLDAILYLSRVVKWRKFAALRFSGLPRQLEQTSNASFHQRTNPSIQCLTSQSRPQNLSHKAVAKGEVPVCAFCGLLWGLLAPLCAARQRAPFRRCAFLLITGCIFTLWPTSSSLGVTVHAAIGSECTLALCWPPNG